MGRVGPVGRTLDIVVAAVLLLTLGLTAATETSLLDAVKRGDTAAVRSLLRAQDGRQRGATPTARRRCTGRRSATISTAVEALLAAGADATAANRYGVTPLALAATNGNAAMIERLLAAGADANTALPGGETVLMTAARAGNAAAVRALLAAARTCTPASRPRARPR